MTYNLKISCTKDRLREIRQFVSDILIKHEFPEAESNKIILAVDEVCANLIIHSNHCNPTETLQLSIAYDNDKIVFEIFDQGDGFNLSEYKEPSMDELIKAKRKGGVGLLLVKRIMDDIQFIRRSGKNVCRLVKNLS